MAARLSTKPDASFFRKIVVGAVGARAVISDLANHGHEFIELERGSTDTKLWKGVKRKRVRIPDLVCQRCGQRIECRAKTKNDLAMSHSPNDEERSWNFGMAENDWIAFPVCVAIEEADSTLGRLRDSGSFWNEQNRITWQTNAHINYFTVAEFLKHQHNRSSTKSGEEGAETFIQWKATFCTKEAGEVTRVDHVEGKVQVTPAEGRSHTWSVNAPLKIVVREGEAVRFGQVLAVAPAPIRHDDLGCVGIISDSQLIEMLQSRQRTRRFTGIKLARTRHATQFESLIKPLTLDNDEDVYVRLEGISYLVAVCNHSARELFNEYLNGNDEQNQLEAVIAIGEAGNEDAVSLLAELIRDETRPYFLRSAAAWSLGQTGLSSANQHLIDAFAGIDQELRHDALETLVGLGGHAISGLINGLQASNPDIVAGCAETIRQQQSLPEEAISFLTSAIQDSEPSSWIVWLVGQLGDEQFRESVDRLSEDSPQIHYAINLMWSFTESWISQRWILRSNPGRSNVDS